MPDTGEGAEALCVAARSNGGGTRPKCSLQPSTIERCSLRSQARRRTSTASPEEAASPSSSDSRGRVVAPSIMAKMSSKTDGVGAFCSGDARAFSGRATTSLLDVSLSSSEPLSSACHSSSCSDSNRSSTCCNRF